MANVYDTLRDCYLNYLPSERPIEIRHRMSLTEDEARLLQRQLTECLDELDRYYGDR